MDNINERRLELHAALKKVCPNVYFSPPEGHRIVYPCIVYNRTINNALYANNMTYMRKVRYDLQVITREPDDLLHLKVANEFRMSDSGSSFTKDNLYHHNLTLYY